MKKQSNHLFNSIVNVDIANLTPATNETVAFDGTNAGMKSFTSAELWNIQRHAKARIQRRYF